MAHAKLADSISKLLETGEYSDLIIETRDENFKVHKTVVCPLSTYFQNAVKENKFKEGQTGIIDWSSDEDIFESNTVRKLLKCLYDGDCETGFDDKGCVIAGSSSILLNLFFLADYAQCPVAQELALDNLINVLGEERAPNLANAIDTAYKHAIPSSDFGKRLEASLLSEAVANLDDLLELDGFNELLEQRGAFARDVVQALNKHHVSGMIVKHVGSSSLSCFCSKCKFAFILPSFPAGLVKEAPPKCPLCSSSSRTRVAANAVSAWTCPATTCEYSIYAALPDTVSRPFICPECAYIGVFSERKVQSW